MRLNIFPPVGGCDTGQLQKHAQLLFMLPVTIDLDSIALVGVAQSSNCGPTMKDRAVGRIGKHKYSHFVFLVMFESRQQIHLGFQELLFLVSTDS